MSKLHSSTAPTALSKKMKKKRQQQHKTEKLKKKRDNCFLFYKRDQIARRYEAASGLPYSRDTYPGDIDWTDDMSRSILKDEDTNAITKYISQSWNSLAKDHPGADPSGQLPWIYEAIVTTVQREAGITFPTTTDLNCHSDANPITALNCVYDHPPPPRQYKKRPEPLVMELPPLDVPASSLTDLHRHMARGEISVALPSPLSLLMMETHCSSNACTSSYVAAPETAASTAGDAHHPLTPLSFQDMYSPLSWPCTVSPCGDTFGSYNPETPTLLRAGAGVGAWSGSWVDTGGPCDDGMAQARFNLHVLTTPGKTPHVLSTRS